MTDIFIPNFHFFCQDGSCAFVVNATNVKRLAPGEYSAECHVPANFLNDGVYSIGILLTSFESGAFCPLSRERVPLCLTCAIQLKA